MSKMAEYAVPRTLALVETSKEKHKLSEPMMEKPQKAFKGIQQPRKKAT